MLLVLGCHNRIVIPQKEGTMHIMNSLQIDYFLKVAEKKNFTLAADELFVSQPAVSRQIVHMETELGVALFIRQAQGVQLTEAGQEFFAFFRQYRQALKVLTEKYTADDTRSSITIGIQSGLSYHLVDQMICALQAEFSERADITVRIEPFHALNELLKEDNSLVIMSEDMIRDKSSVTVIPVMPIQAALVYSELLFRAEQSVHSIELFRQKPLLIFDENDATSDYKRIVLSICKKNGLRPDVKEVNSRDKLSRELLAGHGYTIGSAVSNEPASSKFIRTFPLDVYLNMSLVCKKGSKLPVDAMAKFLSTEHMQTLLKSCLTND